VGTSTFEETPPLAADVFYGQHLM